MQYSLSKFDNKFVWTSPHRTYNLMDKSEAIAFGYWNFHIERNEINYATSQLDQIHNTVYFSDLGFVEDLGNIRKEKINFNTFGLLEE